MVPNAMQAAIDCKVPVYADLSDPLGYLQAALALSPAAAAAGTSAVVSAGAFPGLSNVLAVECASRLLAAGESAIQDIKFSYFTAGVAQRTLLL
jgi:saccharopine dehydrogenase-like NADP-dependent oxidoreductase